MMMEHRSATEGAAAGWQAGNEFALELVGVLHEKVRVRPTSFHCGLFIGCDCHTIGDQSSILWAAPVGKVSLAHLAAFEEACSLWDRVQKTLNRAIIASAENVLSSRADEPAKVTPSKGSFGWFSISPNLHILMFNAPDFLKICSGVGIYGEQGLETRHGRYGENAVKFLGATELERAEEFMRVMALALAALVDVLPRYVANRRSAAAGARKAIEGDRQTAAGEQAIVASARHRECEGGQEAEAVGSGYY